jgi:hypothetical protein
MYIACPTVLRPAILATFRVFNSIVSSGRSKRVMKFYEFDYPKFWEGKNVHISVASKKIAQLQLNGLFPITNSALTDHN